jgi:haloacetate dehalogenase
MLGNEVRIHTGDVTLFARRAGSGRPVLLLHGFPETHLMWRDVAPLLARQFTVICADLRGYGNSSCPASAPDHAPYSKRVMARDMTLLMEHLGYTRFAVVGHDRGGRVAYRMALDHPACIERLAVLDILPTATVWDHANADLALGFWPWSLLAQPEPFPEQILTAVPKAIIDNALDKWGSAPDAFPAYVRSAYVEALSKPENAHAICEEYRAAAAIDREHDKADQEAGRRITAPLLALWSANGALEAWYQNEGGPLALWRRWADDVTGHAIEGGHFFPEEKPELLAQLLTRFFA